MISRLARYSKAFAAAATAAGVTAASLADGHLTPEELTSTIVAWIGVATVYAATNRPLPPPPPASSVPSPASATVHPTTPLDPKD